MKKINILITILILSVSAYSQIPNAGFENWTNGIPDNWISGNGAAFVTPDSNAHDGFLAAKLQPFLDISGLTTSTFFTRVAPGSSYYPVGTSTPPTSIQFWAITNLTGGDVLTFNTTLKNSSNIIAVINGICITTSSPTYQFYSFPISYSSMTMPDSSATWFSIKNGGCIGTNLVNAASFAIIDGLSFDNPSAGIQSVNENSIIQSVYPNPASGISTLTCAIKNSSNIEIEMYDLKGNKIISRNESIKSTGTFTFPVDLSGFPDGLYYIRVKTDSGICVKKLSVYH